MNRTDFIERMTEKGYTKRDAEQVMDDMLMTITECLLDGETVKFHGFGTFSVTELSPREYVDIQTKERLVTPGHKTPKFSPGKLLKRTIREGLLRE